MNEYAFDVKLFAVVRVKAPTLEEAIEAMEVVIDGLEPSPRTLERINEQMDCTYGDTVEITEVSLSGPRDEAENYVPFEINGKEVGCAT